MDNCHVAFRKQDIIGYLDIENALVCFTCSFQKTNSRMSTTSSKHKTYEEIGRGDRSGSIIYRARQEQSLEFVAAKKTNVSNKTIKEKVQREAAYLNTSMHPNILRFLSWFQTNNDIWIITELCEGGSFESILSREIHYFPEVCVESFMTDVREALHFLHIKGIIYNNVHPKNILSDANGVLKLSDFEFALQMSKAKQLTAQEIDRSIAGLGFMHRAPETLIPGGCLSFYSDLFSFGTLIYRSLFKKYPYEPIYEKVRSKIVENANYFEDDNDGSTQESAAELYAREVLKSGEDFLLNNLVPVNYKGVPISVAAKELLFRLLQPLPFKRMTWTELVSCSFFNKKIKEKVSLGVEKGYISMLKQFCSTGVFGEAYKKIYIGPDGTVQLQRALLANIERFMSRLQQQKETPFGQDTLERHGSDEGRHLSDTHDNTEGKKQTEIPTDQFASPFENTPGDFSLGTFYVDFVTLKPIVDIINSQTARGIDPNQIYETVILNLHLSILQYNRDALSLLVYHPLVFLSRNFTHNSEAKSDEEILQLSEAHMYQDTRTTFKQLESLIMSDDYAIISESLDSIHAFMVNCIASAVNSLLGDDVYDSRVGFGTFNRRSDLDRILAATCLLYYNFLFGPPASSVDTLTAAYTHWNTANSNHHTSFLLQTLMSPHKVLNRNYTTDDAPQDYRRGLTKKGSQQGIAIFQTSISGFAMFLQIILVLLRMQLYRSAKVSIATLYGYDVKTLIKHALDYAASELMVTIYSEMQPERLLIKFTNCRIILFTFVENLFILLNEFYSYVGQPVGSSSYNFAKLQLIRDHVPTHELYTLMAFFFRDLITPEYNVYVKQIFSANLQTMHEESVRSCVRACFTMYTLDFAPLFSALAPTLIVSLDIGQLLHNENLASYGLAFYTTCAFVEIMGDYFSPTNDKSSTSSAVASRIRKHYDLFVGKDRQYVCTAFFCEHYRTLMSLLITPTPISTKTYAIMLTNLVLFFDSNTFALLADPILAERHSLYSLLKKRTLVPRYTGSSAKLPEKPGPMFTDQTENPDFLKVLSNVLGIAAQILKDRTSIRADYIEVNTFILEYLLMHYTCIDRFLNGNTHPGLPSEYTEQSFNYEFEQSTTNLMEIRTKATQDLMHNFAFIDSLAAFIASLTVFIDLLASSFKQSILSGSTIQMKNCSRVRPALELIDDLLGHQKIIYTQVCICRPLVLNMESVIFALANTTFSIVPSRALFYCAKLTTLRASQHAGSMGDEDIDEHTVETANQKEEQRIRNTVEAKGSPTFQGLQKDLLSLIKIILSVASGIASLPGHPFIRDHLFYVSELSKKVKGLLFALMNLLKDAYNFSLFEKLEASVLTAKNISADHVFQFNLCIELFRYLRDAVSHILWQGLTHATSCPLYCRSTNIDAFIEESSAFKVITLDDGFDRILLSMDVLDRGMFLGEVLPLTTVQMFTNSITAAYTRLINSNSMLFSLFSTHQFVDIGLQLVLGALSTGKISLTIELRKFIVQSLTHNNSFAPTLLQVLYYALTDGPTWQIFTANQGSRFLVANSHFDYQSDETLDSYNRILRILLQSSRMLVSVLNDSMASLGGGSKTADDGPEEAQLSTLEFFSKYKRDILLDHFLVLKAGKLTPDIAHRIVALFFEHLVISDTQSPPKAAQNENTAFDSRTFIYIDPRYEFLLKTMQLITNLANIYGWSQELAYLYFRPLYVEIVQQVTKWINENINTLKSVQLDETLISAFIDLVDSMLFVECETCTVMDVYQSIGQIGRNLKRQIRVKLEALKISFLNPYARNLPPANWYIGIISNIRDE